MKKVYLFVLAAFVSLVSDDAQIVRSTDAPQTVQSVEYTFDDYEDGDKKVFYTLRFGGGASTLVGDRAKNLSSFASYAADFGLGLRIGGKGFYWGAEAGFGARSYQSSSGDDVRLMAHNLKLTFTQFGWKIRLGDSKWAFDPHVGAYVSFDYAGKINYEYNRKKVSQSIGDDDSWNRFDLGLNVGGGFWIKKFNFDVTYMRGFMEAAEKAEVKSSSVIVRLGFTF